MPAFAGAVARPLAFADLDGWAQDDAGAAFAVFRAGCGALAVPPATVGPPSNPWARAGLVRACAAAAAVERALAGRAPSKRVARLFFEANFRPFRIVPGDRPEGFFTGYYEPEIEGSATPGPDYTVPVLARPADLIVAGRPGVANGGAAFREENRRRVPYHDRAAIEDGALAGRGLELCWLKAPVDLFFMQIQGSGRVRLPDGRVLRLNYDGYNGLPYTPVGRLLIAQGLVPRDEMSMDRIRAYIEADPAAGRALMRENRSYVFFKALPLGPEAGAMGALGVPLAAGRSLAVDRAVHTYGLPVFVAADLPLEASGGRAPFRRLMIAQDTGSAIVGPARADLYFGAGDAAGRVAGRIRHAGHFTVLAPRLAPVEAQP